RSAARWGWRVLTTTTRPSEDWTARYTVPIAPAPSRSEIWNPPRVEGMFIGSSSVVADPMVPPVFAPLRGATIEEPSSPCQGRLDRKDSRIEVARNLAQTVWGGETAEVTRDPGPRPETRIDESRRAA